MSGIKKRHCWLIGAHEHTQSLSTLLAPQGWVVVSHPAAAQRQKLQQRHGIHVGLIDCSDSTVLEQLSACRDLLTDPHTLWLALLPRDGLALEAVRQLVAAYCWDYLTLPLDTARLSLALGHAHGLRALVSGPSRAESSGDGANALIGHCGAMRHVHHFIQKVSESLAPVLITGETGTGKEVVARSIHERSDRRDGPFVAINCGALPAQLLQSELFGYEKGAFTGANQRKIGRIEMAHQGTLLLDEIGDLPFEAQANLLRFLQEGCIERLGGTQTLTTDVRVIAATHVDLKAAIEQGRFREDLYHRLNVLHVHLPPLRERADDIALLAHHYFETFRRDGAQSRVRGFSSDALDALIRYDWPGNVRELVNRVQRALVMTDNRNISAADLGIEEKLVKPPTLEEIRSVAELQALRAALRRNPRNLSKAAKELNVSRVTLYRMIERFKSELDQAQTGWIPRILQTQAEDAKVDAEQTSLLDGSSTARAPKRRAEDHGLVELVSDKAQDNATDDSTIERPHLLRHSKLNA